MRGDNKKVYFYHVSFQYISNIIFHAFTEDKILRGIVIHLEILILHHPVILPLWEKNCYC